MKLSSRTLNPLTLPLTGKLLIEASAGTGKTYSITSIILRVLVDHLLPDTLTESAPASSAYQLKDILVVTFTKDATAELKERIQLRINQAVDDFESGRSEDAYIASLLEHLAAKRKEATKAFKLAQQSIHEASIFTIHAFCLQLIKEFSLETGEWFKTQLNKDEVQLNQRFAQDFWRQHVYEADAWQASLYQDSSLFGQSPNNVEKQLKNWKSRAEFQLADQTDQPFEAWLDQLRATEQAFTELWHKQQDELAEYLASSTEIGHSTYKKGNNARFIQSVNDAITSGQSLTNVESLKYFTKTKLMDSSKTPHFEQLSLSTPTKQIFVLGDRLFEEKNALYVAYYAHQIKSYRAQLTQLYEQDQQLTFNTVIQQTEQALRHVHTNSATQQRLAQRFRLGLIDEFQDTDQRQYQIFSQLFSGENQGLMMIGDPKQAIYTFRGGDLETYLMARSQADQCFTLATNWRSSPELIAAYNALYTAADQPFLSDQIEYEIVSASPEPKPVLHVDKQPLQALTTFDASSMTASSDGRTVTKEAMISRLAAHVAHTLRHYLNAGELIDAQGKATKLELNDIAILVRNATEATAIKEALDEQQLRYSYFSDKTKIFKTSAADSLRFLLNAIEQPRAIKPLKTVLATELFGWSLDRIRELENESNTLATLQVALIKAKKRLQTHGLFEALHQLYHDLELLAQLLSDKSKRQFLANLLQLTQHLHERFPSETRVNVFYTYLRDQHQNDDPAQEDDDDIRLQIEDTQKRISIYTLHKSKGLQFKLVFMPFIGLKLSAPRSLLWFYHQQTPEKDNTQKRKRLIAKLAKGKEIETKATKTTTDPGKLLSDHEHQQEAARLLYVGLTRAIAHCFLYLPSSDDLKPSPLGHLLCSKDDDSNCLEQALSKLQALAYSQVETLVTDDDAIAPNSFEHTSNWHDAHSTANKQVPQLEALNFTRSLKQPAQITSYTALTRHHDHVTTDSSSLDPTSYDNKHKLEHIDEPELSNEAKQPANTTGLVSAPSTPTTLDLFSEQSRFEFPAGAQAGLFLHQWLETLVENSKLWQLAQLQDITSHDWRSPIASMLSQYTIAESFADCLPNWLNDILQADLSADQGTTAMSSLQLGQLTPSQCLPEMNFLLALRPITQAKLNQLLRKSPIAPSDGELNFADVEGFLTGAIDLTFEHQGRFFIMDYKSNHLGHSATQYASSVLLRAMQEHRYDVQLLIYTLAMHLHLQQCLPDYDYEQHMGGAYYVFLRGMQANQQSGVFFHRPDRQLIEALSKLISPNFKTLRQEESP
ncbi:MAG: exodeoxyribonuclease V subunit beta [Pseudomonadota bacterium]|nr:exodeoxyribonuclease V subunit beta [Pseudomonadota bacterium]